MNSRRGAARFNAASLLFGSTPLAWSWCLLLAGCHALIDAPPSGEGLDALLKPVSASPDGVTLEVFHVRVGGAEQDAIAAVWDHADEMALDDDARSLLAANGFRAGVLSGSLPTELSQLLMPPELEAHPNSAQVVTDEVAKPRVKRSLMNLRRHEESPIKSAEPQNELSVMLSDDGQSLRAATYRLAEPVYSLTAQAVAGQRVSLELTPELHHGRMQNRYTAGSQGMFTYTQSRDRDVFEQLSLAAEIEPGELLILGAAADAPSSLGYAFHRSGLGDGDAKLIIVRAAQVPPTEILADN